MTEAYGSERQVRARRLGLAVGHILLWAVEQQAQVDDLVIENVEKNEHWPKDDNHFLKYWLKNEQIRHREKLVWRKFAADSLTDLGMILKVKNQHETVASGRLLKVDLPYASIVMANLSSNDFRTVTFAARRPAPVVEDQQLRSPQQSYFGHSLIVDFEVVSIPPENESLLQ